MSDKTDRATLTDDQIEAWEIVARNASQTDATWQYGAVRENVLEYVRETYERGAPGPLHTVHFQADEADHQSWIVAFTGNGKHSEANAKYIAWSSPRNVLALLREFRELRDRARPAQVDEAALRAAFDAGFSAGFEASGEGCNGEYTRREFNWERFAATYGGDAWAAYRNDLPARPARSLMPDQRALLDQIADVRRMAVDAGMYDADDFIGQMLPARPSSPAPADDVTACPGPECPMCSGAVCALCGAGASRNPSVDGKRCDHDSTERHEESPAPAPGEPTGADCAFRVGDRVRKVGGDYSIDGTVRAVFAKASGAVRLVVEAINPPGLLHIYSEKNLERIGEPTGAGLTVLTALAHVKLWDAINAFAVASGGSASRVSPERMKAVSAVEDALRHILSLVPASEAP